MTCSRDSLSHLRTNSRPLQPRYRNNPVLPYSVARPLPFRVFVFSSVRSTSKSLRLVVFTALIKDEAFHYITSPHRYEPESVSCMNRALGASQLRS